MAAVNAMKTSWADEVDDFVTPEAPRIEEIVGPDGLITVVGPTTNEEGRKVKITRRIKRTAVQNAVDPVVAARKIWDKFGNDRGKPHGPDRATTTVGENIGLKIVAGGQKVEPEPEQEDAFKKQLEGKKITCRTCKGGHFTSKCPYKDTLGALGVGGIHIPENGTGTPQNESVAPVLSRDKYIPIHKRKLGTSGTGESMAQPGGNRDDLPTLRVSNVSVDTDENDLRELFSAFGRVARVYIGKDRDPGARKGYAFVSFEDRAVAEKAMQTTDGRGYDNLILSVQWSEPRPEPRG